MDGVVTRGILPGPGDVIVTGRCPPGDVQRTYKELEANSIPYTAVYFMPPHLKQRGTRAGLVNTGAWKAQMIEKLRLHEFFEDDPVQHQTIVDYCQSFGVLCKIHRVINGKVQP